MKRDTFKIILDLYFGFTEFKKAEEKQEKIQAEKYLFNGKVYENEKKYFYTIVRYYQRKNPSIVKRLKQCSQEKEKITEILKEISARFPLWHYALFNYYKKG